MKGDIETVDYIEEEGVVTDVNPGRGELRVRITSNSECGSCPASKLCSVGTGEGTEVPVAVRNAGHYRKGDVVRVRGTERMHRKAIMLATVLPCLALIAVMVIIYVLTGNQLAAAIGGLITMICFFGTLYLCRNRIAHEFVFEIVKD